MSATKDRTEEIDELVSTLASIGDKGMMLKLLEDLCTPRELTEIAQRLQVAKMLIAGKQYIAIQEETGASATTVARVSRTLNYGTDGYKEVLNTEG